MRAPWLKFLYASRATLSCSATLTLRLSILEKKAMDSQQNNMNVDGSQPLTSPSQTPTTVMPSADANIQHPWAFKVFLRNPL